MLFPKQDFVGISSVIHLAAGGETPPLVSHQSAVSRFFADKADGMPGRVRFFATREAAAAQIAALLHGEAADVAFVGSSSAGMTSIVSAYDWQPGDEVVTVDDEYPSGRFLFGWLRRHGVRCVMPAYHPDPLEEAAHICAAITVRTKLVYVSHVSTRTGRRIPLERIIATAHAHGAQVLVDATHSLGVIDVDARDIDYLVCSGYKWLLGTHLGIVYWNRRLVPHFEPQPGWRSALPDSDAALYHLHQDAARIEVGNPNFLDVYILENALRYRAHIAPAALESYVSTQVERLWHGCAAAGATLLTPLAAAHRAGNVCLAHTNPAAVVAAARAQGLVIWGDADLQRIRLSVHGYVTPDDVTQTIGLLPELLRNG